MRLSTERLVIWAVLAVSVVTLGLQAFVLRPHLWPAGAGLALSGDIVMGTLAAPSAVTVIRPPNIKDVVGTTVSVLDVQPNSPAQRGGFRAGTDYQQLPADPQEVLRIWRYQQRVTADQPPTALDAVPLERRAIWVIDDPPWSAWLRRHLGPLAQMTAFLSGAIVLLALGAHGTTAALMTLALIFTAVANSGPLLGSHAFVPIAGPLLLVFNWLSTALSFPIIGLAVLYFPHRAEILDRHRWIV